VLAAIVQVMQLGLEPNRVLGQVYLTPYGKQCQLVAGYRGLIALTQGIEHIERVYAHVVYGADEFEFELGLEERLVHKPALDRARQSEPSLAEPVCAYAVIVYASGERRFEVVTADRMEQIRAGSRGSDHPQSPWQIHREEMWRKAALRELLRFEPLPPEHALSRAIRLDGALFNDHSLGDDGRLAPDLEPDPHAGRIWPAPISRPPGAPAPAPNAPDVTPPAAPARRRRRSKPDEPQQAAEPEPASSAPDPEADTRRAPETPDPSSDEGTDGEQAPEKTSADAPDVVPPVTRPRRQPNLPNVQ
jgi:recombination protein RecT